MTTTIQAIVNDSTNSADLNYTYHYIEANQGRINTLYENVKKSVSRLYDVKGDAMNMRVTLKDYDDSHVALKDIERIILECFTELDIDTAFRTNLFSVRLLGQKIYITKR